VNRWTDNAFNLKTFLKKKVGDSGKEADAKLRQMGISADWDYFD